MRKKFEDEARKNLEKIMSVIDGGVKKEDVVSLILLHRVWFFYTEFIWVWFFYNWVWFFYTWFLESSEQREPENMEKIRKSENTTNRDILNSDRIEVVEWFK